MAKITTKTKTAKTKKPAPAKKPARAAQSGEAVAALTRAVLDLGSHLEAALFSNAEALASIQSRLDLILTHLASRPALPAAPVVIPPVDYGRAPFPGEVTCTAGEAPAVAPPDAQDAY